MLSHAASMDTEVDTFRLDSVVHGYHIYKNIWSNMLGKELQYIHEMGNVHDLYIVGVIMMEIGTVGHFPKKISTPCYLFLRKGGITLGMITGRCLYSIDLPQGDLKIPCELMFKGDMKSFNKVKQLLHKLPAISPSVSFQKAQNNLTNCTEAPPICKPSPSI